MLLNTDRVFKRSYIPRYIRVDLLRINFVVSSIAENSNEIFKLLRRASFKSDPNVPLYPIRYNV